MPDSITYQLNGASTDGETSHPAGTEATVTCDAGIYQEVDYYDADGNYVGYLDDQPTVVAECIAGAWAAAGGSDNWLRLFAVVSCYV